MATILVVLAVGAALLIGALWGLYGKLPGRVEGFVIALAGGALVLSLVSELIEPSIERSNMLVAIAGIAAGAVVFTGVDYLIDETWGESSGGGAACRYHAGWCAGKPGPGRCPDFGEPA